MAKQLLKLRNVPADELAEIYELLESHEIEFTRRVLGIGVFPCRHYG